MCLCVCVVIVVSALYNSIFWVIVDQCHCGITVEETGHQYLACIGEAAICLSLIQLRQSSVDRDFCTFNKLIGSLLLHYDSC